MADPPIVALAEFDIPRCGHHAIGSLSQFYYREKSTFRPGVFAFPAGQKSVPFEKDRIDPVLFLIEGRYRHVDVLRLR